MRIKDEPVEVSLSVEMSAPVSPVNCIYTMSVTCESKWGNGGFCSLWHLWLGRHSKWIAREYVWQHAHNQPGLYDACNMPMQQAFTEFGPPPMKTCLHQHRTFNSFNLYVNWTLKTLNCVFFYIHPANEWMWTPNHGIPQQWHRWTNA